MSERVFRNPILTRTWEQLRDSVFDLFGFVVPTYTQTSSDYTTDPKASWEIVDCTGTGTKTITLHSGGRQLQRVTVKRTGTGAVNIATEGSETIDAAASDSLASQFDYQDHWYIEDVTDWRVW